MQCQTDFLEKKWFTACLNQLSRWSKTADDVTITPEKVASIFPRLQALNKTKRSHTQLDSRKQVIAFQDRVITINIKEAQHPLKWEKQIIDKSSIMLKISTKSMHRVLVWEIGPANNTTRCSGLSKHHLLHAWHPSQLAINLHLDKS